jgi:hypothetical protein
MVGPPTWPVRAIAIGVVIAIFTGIIIWHAGFESGRRWSDER